jgi:hypothetical protein
MGGRSIVGRSLEVEPIAGLTPSPNVIFLHKHPGPQKSKPAVSSLTRALIIQARPGPSYYSALKTLINIEARSRYHEPVLRAGSLPTERLFLFNIETGHLIQVERVAADVNYLNFCVSKCAAPAFVDEIRPRIEVAVEPHLLNITYLQIYM